MVVGTQSVPGERKMENDKFAWFVGLLVSAFVFVFFTVLVVSLINRSNNGDVENTKRTKARYEMCATIPDSASRTLCSLDIKTGY